MSNLESSKYTQYLPRIFQKGSTQTDEEYFLGRFLKAFEQILTGDSEQKETIGIEKLLDSFDEYFNPSQTPAQFLQWLSGWVGLELEEGTDFYGVDDKEQMSTEPTQILPLEQVKTTINRGMIGTMVQLYKKRGTCNGLLEYLQLYCGEEPTFTIDEFLDTARVGESRRIGFNSMVGGSRPTFFCVNAIMPVHSRSMLQKKVDLIYRLMESEKPFYTNYKLNVEIPAMSVGVYSKVGKTTLLGGIVED
jgi:phage tail-like protein